MSQQINLLTREQQPVGSALWALAAVAVVLLGLLVYGAMLRADIRQLSLAAEAGQRDLARVKAAMEAKRQRASAQGAGANDDAAALKAEIAALKPRAEMARQLLEPANQASLGSPDGYARYLGKLGSLNEEGLWLTSISVGNAGKLVNLSGKALRSESVLRYARRLNEAFAADEVQFKSVEMTPESPAGAAEPGKPVLMTVVFKLF